MITIKTLILKGLPFISLFVFMNKFYGLNLSIFTSTYETIVFCAVMAVFVAWTNITDENCKIG